MIDFVDRKCKPCEGGAVPLSVGAAKSAMAELHAAWKLDEDGRTIRRQFDFPAYSRTIAFANAVAWIATIEGHHPEMTVNYGRLDVAYRTTAIDGLSDNDFICAAKIDRLAWMGQQ
jgi:4a-hydroxytetrahydrobiopterin dehydratase